MEVSLIEIMAIPEPPQDDMKAPNEEEMITAFDINQNYDPFSDEETMKRLRTEGYVVTGFMFDEGGNELPFRRPSGVEVIEVDAKEDNPGGVEKRYLVYDPTMVEVREVKPSLEPKMDSDLGSNSGWEEIDTDLPVVYYVRRI